MTGIVAIDPGTTESAFVELCEGRPYGGTRANGTLLEALSDKQRWTDGTVLAIEMIASYGMPVGAEVFETCVWIGRFLQAWNGPHTFVYRKDVKLHLCGQTRAKDSNVRAALIDRFGGKQAALGNKKQPGPLYGIKADIWSALAVAVTYADGAAGKAA